MDGKPGNMLLLRQHPSAGQDRERGYGMIGCEIIKILSKNNTSGSVKEKGFQQFCHWHSDIEYIYIKKGYLLLELDGNNITLNEGNFIIIASNVLHTFLESDSESFLYIARVPLDDFYTWKYLNLPDIVMLHKKCMLITNPTPSFVAIFEDMISADYGVYNQMYILAKAVELTAHLLTKKVTITKRIDARTVESSDITLEIQAFIEKSLSQPLSLPMVSKHLGYSEAYCSKIIRQKTNMGFMEYVNQVRLREAEAYLQKTDISITDICHTVGFNSIVSFNRNFKKRHGISPTQFRKNTR